MLSFRRPVTKTARSYTACNRGNFGSQGHRRTRFQLTTTHFFFGNTKPTPDLWNYNGTAVKNLGLDNILRIHRFSYDHRNRKTVLLVTYVPWDDKCRQLEVEIERLAKGLAHEDGVVVAKLNCEGAAEREYAQRVLESKQYPSIYIFPEGKRGFARYRGEHVDAQAILASMNRVCNFDASMEGELLPAGSAARRHWELQGEALTLVPVPDSKREMARQAARDSAASWRWQLFSAAMGAAALVLLLRLFIVLLDAMRLQERDQRKAFARATVDAWLRAWQTLMGAAAAAAAMLTRVVGQLRGRLPRGGAKGASG